LNTTSALEGGESQTDCQSRGRRGGSEKKTKKVMDPDAGKATDKRSGGTPVELGRGQRGGKTGGKSRNFRKNLI